MKAPSNVATLAFSARHFNAQATSLILHTFPFHMIWPISNSPADLDGPSHTLTAHRASFHLASTRLAGADVPTRIEKRVHFFFIADLAKLHIILGGRILHHSLSAAFTLLELTLVDVAPLGVGHLTFSMRLIVLPVAFVHVFVCPDHLAV